MTRLLAAVLLSAFAAAAASAQVAQGANAGRIQIDSLDRLGPRAAETVNVNLGEQLLKFIPFSKEDPDDADVKDLVAGLRGVYVKRFEFDAAGAYNESDIAPIRAQLSGANWTRIVEVMSRREDAKNIEVYLAMEGSRVDGLVVLSVAPKELTVINIVGKVDLEKLRKLEGNFGVPKLEIERDPSKAPKTGAATKKP
ncbi:MAG TPA: DUF4252 domain-containing protein [Pyrinomonadaceae bacterium]|jgi:hypothetical protein|nr:DUF4252 domain-containing protein [Pyrinomonadaceae bacterium]